MWGFVEIGHLDKHFKNMSKTQEKEDPQQNILEIFFLLLKLHFERKIWLKNRNNQGYSFQKQDTFHLFRFLKRAKDASPLPSTSFCTC